MENGLRIYSATIIIILTMICLITLIFDNIKGRRISAFIYIAFLIPIIYYFIKF